MGPSCPRSQGGLLQQGRTGTHPDFLRTLCAGAAECSGVSSASPRDPQSFPCRAAPPCLQRPPTTCAPGQAVRSVQLYPKPRAAFLGHTQAGPFLFNFHCGGTCSLHSLFVWPCSSLSGPPMHRAYCPQPTTAAPPPPLLRFFTLKLHPGELLSLSHTRLRNHRLRNSSPVRNSRDRGQQTHIAATISPARCGTARATCFRVTSFLPLLSARVTGWMGSLHYTAVILAPVEPFLLPQPASSSSLLVPLVICASYMLY